MLRLLRRFALITMAVLAMVIIALAAIGYFFQDEVKAKLVAELNTHLTAPLHQDGIELTLIKRFPQASLRIRNAYMQEVRTDGQPTDTLLYAEDIYLEFSLLSLLTGEHVVREVHGNNVKLYPGLDTNGAENWTVWKTDTADAATGEHTGIDLRRVTFKGLGGRFRDARTGLEVACTSEKLALRAHFRDQGSRLSAKGDIRLRRWAKQGELLLADRKAALDATMTFGGPSGGFRVEQAELLFGRNTVNLVLAVEEGKGGDELDLRANGFDLDLADMVQLLPDALRKAIRRYGVAGRADLALHFSGPLDQEGPALSIGMKLHDGRFTELASGTAFRKVQGEWSADLTSRWEPKKLVVKNFSATSLSGPVAGNLELVGMRNAKLTANLSADLGLADLLRFAGLDTLEQVSGRLKAEARIGGKLRDAADIKAIDLRGLAVSGKVALKDASLKMKGLRHQVTALNADLALNGNDATVHGLRFLLQGNAMEISGTLHNLMPFALFKDQRLTIEAKGDAPVVDLASLLEAQGTNKGGAQPAYAFTLPALIDLDLKARIGVLKMERFQADNIVCNLHMTGQQLALEPLSFNTADGRVTGSLSLDARSASAYPLAINADLKGIDITKLFAEFRNFGQQFITDAHVKGKGDAQVRFTAPLRPDFSLDQPNLYCVADVTLRNGELNNHASLLAVADYLRQNKLISPFVDAGALRKELKHVSFAKLENRIEIKDRAVHLPLMTVSSSVMDLEVSGTHGFDGAVDDHLNFRLGDLFRSGKGSDDEFGPVIDDGTGLRIFLHMYGTTDNLQFGHDGAMAAVRRKERMKQESAQLKGILKGIVSGQGAASAEVPQARQQGRITVDFGKDEELAAPVPAPKPKKGLGRLLQKNDQEEPKVTIGVE